MLHIVVPEMEFFNESTNEFFSIKEQKLSLEHSLVSISKWEAKWKKAFIGTPEKTREEILDYIRCMTITQNVNPLVYEALTSENIKAVCDYIDDPMTATKFNDSRKTSGRVKSKIVTSEEIYYQMIANNIPPEYQKWHINRLITLIRVCQIKGDKPKKMKKSEVAKQNAAINEARRKKMNSKG